MFGLVIFVLPIIGAYAVYIDATNRETDGPIWWALLTLVIGYLLTPILMAVFLLLYLLLHVGEEYWDRRHTGGIPNGILPLRVRASVFATPFQPLRSLSVESLAQCRMCKHQRVARLVLNST